MRLPGFLRSARNLTLRAVTTVVLAAVLSPALAAGSVPLVNVALPELLVGDPAPTQRAEPALQDALPAHAGSPRTGPPPAPGLLPSASETGRILALQGASCPGMAAMEQAGSTMGELVAHMPGTQCTHPLFSLTTSQYSLVFSDAAITSAVQRLQQETRAYNARNPALVNVVLYLRAGYYGATTLGLAPPKPEHLLAIRASIEQFIETPLFLTENPAAPSTAQEMLILTTNTKDSAHFAPRAIDMIQQLRDAPGTVAANKTVRLGFSGALNVLYHAHWATPSPVGYGNDPRYPRALYEFYRSNKASLEARGYTSLLTDALNESFRFLQYPQQTTAQIPTIRYILENTTMVGPTAEYWLAAASAVEYYLPKQCTEFRICDYKTQVATAILPVWHQCSTDMNIKAQQMTPEQLTATCTTINAQFENFHTTFSTKNQPVSEDHNTSLEVVVFADATQYRTYAGAIYNIDTDNGGMYLEGNPATAGNQARFIAYEASWLRPTFEIWNLEHESVHYLDARYNMAGDFAASTSTPTIWWIEGLAEYLSLNNNNPDAIKEGRTGRYTLSQILANTYDMADYTNRAYRWGYLATRFMFERHQETLTQVLRLFRAGDYPAYEKMRTTLSTKFDQEFDLWLQSVDTVNEPEAKPLALNQWELTHGNANSPAAYRIDVPPGTKSLEIRLDAGAGNADLYLRQGAKATKTHYDFISDGPGNEENIIVETPAAGPWYILLTTNNSFEDAWLTANISPKPTAASSRVTNLVIE